MYSHHRSWSVGLQSQGLSYHAMYEVCFSHSLDILYSSVFEQNLVWRWSLGMRLGYYVAQE